MTDPTRSMRPTDPNLTVTQDDIFRMEYNRGYTDGHGAGIKICHTHPKGSSSIVQPITTDGDKSFTRFLVGLFLGLLLGLLIGLFLGLFISKTIGAS